jgi:rhamnose utilization protein RhaD (predicted bifunctional aldolase and dehydrogenase)/NAD(P)-dependent dehydrogenase (short-subunit alcohol dehydrogenase family)
MKSAWATSDAEAAVARYVRDGIARDLALRVYTTRLLGQNPKLVLHGGGNTSVKTRMTDLNGEEVDVLCVKGSGWDMGTIEPAGLPAVRLEPLKRLRWRNALSDEDMVRVQRANLLDPSAPNPSVETLLHAFLPHAFVDHTHSTAVLSLTDQPEGEKLCEEVYGKRLGYVPYIMPGFALAKAAADAFERDRSVEGLILHKHGIFTFGGDAREAYERMVEHVTLAEERLKRGRKTLAMAKLPGQIAARAEVAPIIRGACALKDEAVEGAWTRMILTKNWPLIVPAPQAGKLEEFSSDVRAAAATFIGKYRTYFDTNNARAGGIKKLLDPAPRVVLVPGLGLYGLGRSRKDARVAADLAEAAIETIADAEAIGRFESLPEPDLFDMEYWSLEQAKLSAAKPLPLAGQIVAVTGAGSGIGAATAKAFAAAGAEVALLDVNENAAKEKAKAIGGAAMSCDVTDVESINRAFAAVVEAFGGLDILVSNAGETPPQGKIGEIDEAAIRKSFELNFYGHQRAAQAMKIMLAQATGGCLLFNASKQAINPGPNFGPYGLPKAATLFLSRQYALDYGAAGIRSNAVNADRIRSGIVTGDFIRERAKARGVSEEEYMRGNLLQREVTAEDVAQAFVSQALALKTTADVTTVDGGNIAAALR